MLAGQIAAAHSTTVAHRGIDLAALVIVIAGYIDLVRFAAVIGGGAYPGNHVGADIGVLVNGGLGVAGGVAAILRGINCAAIIISIA